MWLASGASLRMGAPPSRATLHSKHCPSSAQPQQVQNSKNILQQTLEIKQAVPCLTHRPLHIMEVPWLPFCVEEVSPFCSLKFSVLQMTTFYKPISEEVEFPRTGGEYRQQHSKALFCALFQLRNKVATELSSRG